MSTSFHRRSDKYGARLPNSNEVPAELVDSTPAVFMPAAPALLVAPLSANARPQPTCNCATHPNAQPRSGALLASLHQLLGQGFSVGPVYRLSHGNLRDTFPQAPAPPRAPFDIPREQEREALLHQVRLFLIYNHSSGFFAQWESRWLDQSNDGYGTALRDETFWQHDIFIGYRFPRRRAEIRVGILNLTDEDYRLNPLNVISRLPRERTFYSSLQFNF